MTSTPPERPSLIRDASIGTKQSIGVLSSIEQQVVKPSSPPIYFPWSTTRLAVVAGMLLIGALYITYHTLQANILKRIPPPLAVSTAQSTVDGRSTPSDVSSSTTSGSTAPPMEPARIVNEESPNTAAPTPSAQTPMSSTSAEGQGIQNVFASLSTSANSMPASNNLSSPSPKPITSTSNDAKPVTTATPVPTPSPVGPAPRTIVAPTAQFGGTEMPENAPSPSPNTTSTPSNTPSAPRETKESASANTKRTTGPSTVAALRTLPVREGVERAKTMASEKPKTNPSERKSKDGDVAVISALLSNHKIPSASESKSTSEHSTTGAGSALDLTTVAQLNGDDVAFKMAQCEELNFFERQVCKWEACANQWGKHPSCPSNTSQNTLFNSHPSPQNAP